MDKEAIRRLTSTTHNFLTIYAFRGHTAIMALSAKPTVPQLENRIIADSLFHATDRISHCRIVHAFSVSLICFSRNLQSIE